MGFRRRLKNRKPPSGWELIEDVIEDFENQMKEAVNEEHEGKRRAELTYKIHRIHWEKNRFIYDLMYQRKVMSKELYEYLVREKVADGALISKWRKPGYEILCSTLAINKSNHNFGTTAHCRVPLKKRAPQQKITPNVQTGCISCASGDGRFGGPIWWNTPLEEEGLEEDNRAVWSQKDRKTRSSPCEDDDKTEEIADEDATKIQGTEGIEEYYIPDRSPKSKKQRLDGDEDEYSDDQRPDLSNIVLSPHPRYRGEDDDEDIPEDVRQRLYAMKRGIL